MPKLGLKFHLTEVHPVTRKPLHHENGCREVEIEAPELDPNDLYTSLHDNLEEWDREARKAAASLQVDYESFGSDSAYLDRLDEVAGNFYTEAIEVTGAVNKAYVIEGVYSEGGLWGDTVSGVDPLEAKFQAEWTMAMNCGHSVSLYAGFKSPERWIAGLLSTMDDQSIESVMLDAPNKEMTMAVLENLCKAVRKAGLHLPELDEAESLIAADKAITEAQKSDGIEYVEANSAEPAAPRM